MRLERLRRDPKTLRALRWMAGTAIALTLLEVGYSNLVWINLEGYQKDLLALSGLDALVRFPDAFFASYSFIQVLVLLALIVPLRYADIAFYVNLLIYETAFLFSGFAIGMALQSFLLTLVAYLYGAILFLLLFHRWLRVPDSCSSSRSDQGGQTFKPSTSVK